MDAFDPFFIHKIPDRIRRLLRNLGLQSFITQTDIPCLFRNPVRIQIQYFPQCSGQQFDISLGLLQFPGIQIYGLHRLRSGQDVHIPV